MKQLTATLFRLTFLDLKEPTEVTLHGEVVGEWAPRIPGTNALGPQPRQATRPVTAGRPAPVDLTRRA